MPIKLIAPRPGKTPYYAGRGRHLGVYVDRSTKAVSARLARAVIRQWCLAIECGRLAAAAELTFAQAALRYMQTVKPDARLTPLLHHFGDTACRRIDQAAIDAAALALLPAASAATRNREIYTPVSAVLKRNGFDFKLKRPQGWRGKRRHRWLWPPQAFAIFEAARALDAELWVLCVLLTYGGLRIGEQLAMTCDDVNLAEAFAFVRCSKNGEAQPLHLTPFMIEALRGHPRGLARPGERLFRFHRGGGLDFKLRQACAMACGLAKPTRRRGAPWPTLPPHALDFVSWHVFRYTYANWGRRYLGWDDTDQLATRRWKSKEAAAGYAQGVVGEAARQVDRLPVPQKRRA